MSLLTRVTALVAVSLLATTTAVTATAPAGAATGVAPVTSPDTVRLTQGTARSIDVLGNDTDGDGDDLSVCRLGEVPGKLQVQITGPEIDGLGPPDAESGELFLIASGKPGTYTLTYYACDFSYLTAGTLTIQVEKAPKIKVRVEKLDRPGKLKITNRTGVRVRFLWGSFDNEKVDGVVTVGSKPKVIDVRRPSIFWGAFSPRTRSDFQVGAVRNIRLPRGVDALPPGAPTGPLPDLGADTDTATATATASPRRGWASGQ